MQSWTEPKSDTVFYRIIVLQKDLCSIVVSDLNIPVTEDLDECVKEFLDTDMSVSNYEVQNNCLVILCKIFFSKKKYFAVYDKQNKVFSLFTKTMLNNTIRTFKLDLQDSNNMLFEISFCPTLVRKCNKEDLRAMM